MNFSVNQELRQERESTIYAIKRFIFLSPRVQHDSESGRYHFYLLYPYMDCRSLLEPIQAVKLYSLDRSVACRDPWIHSLIYSQQIKYAFPLIILFITGRGIFVYLAVSIGSQQRSSLYHFVIVDLWRCILKHECSTRLCILLRGLIRNCSILVNILIRGPYYKYLSLNLSNI